MRAGEGAVEEVSHDGDRVILDGSSLSNGRMWKLAPGGKSG